MSETLGKMHMYDVVKIDNNIFRYRRGGGGLLKPLPDR